MLSGQCANLGYTNRTLFSSHTAYSVHRLILVSEVDQPAVITAVCLSTDVSCTEIASQLIPFTRSVEKARNSVETEGRASGRAAPDRL